MRRLLPVLLLLSLAITGLVVAWPKLQVVAALWRLSRMPAPSSLPVPVEGVRTRDIADTWGGPRSGGRWHQGTDIFAPRGTPVRSATAGVIARQGDFGIGGRHVWVIGPGGERHYYAHLDDWAPGLRPWRVVRAGDLLGFVGTTGNARGTPPHLHYGIYAGDGAINPYPRLHDPKSAH